MSFTVKRVTQRASGGEIVRTSEIDKTDIVVGRGADCDLQLTDLALNLRHARIARVAGGRVLIESLSDETFEVDRRFVGRAEFDPGRGPRIVLGEHLLTFARGERADQVTMTVARLAAAEPPANLEARERAMAPGRVGPSKRWTAWALGLGILLAGLAWPISAFLVHANARIHADRQWSSGPLSKAHAFLGGNCAACHQQAFVAVRDDACLTCHRAGESSSAHLKTLALIRSWGGPTDSLRVAGDHANALRILRATPYPAAWGGRAKLAVEKLFNHPENRCASCHREHVGRGDKPALTVVQSCVACHAALKSRLPDTDLFDAPNWARHPQFRPRVATSLVATSLGEARPVLARISWRPGLSDRTGLNFSHAQHLSTTNGVRAMAIALGKISPAAGSLPCEACHRLQGRGFAPIRMVDDCKDCHSLAYARVGGRLLELPHGHPDRVATTLEAYFAGPGMQAPEPAFTRRPPGWTSGAGLPPEPAPTEAAAAIRATFSKGGACFGCHDIKPASPAAPLSFHVAPVHLSQSYLTRGVFDHGLRAHRYRDDGKTLACGDCHAAKTSDKADQLLIPAVTSCQSCHGKTKAQTPAAASADCADCHSWHAPDRPRALAAEKPDPPLLVSFHRAQARMSPDALRGCKGGGAPC